MGDLLNKTVEICIVDWRELTIAKQLMTPWTYSGEVH
jgi:hypothetical protein